MARRTRHARPDHRRRLSIQVGQGRSAARSCRQPHPRYAASKPKRTAVGRNCACFNGRRLHHRRCREGAGSLPGRSFGRASSNRRRSSRRKPDSEKTAFPGGHEMPSTPRTKIPRTEVRQSATETTRAPCGSAAHPFTRRTTACPPRGQVSENGFQNSVDEGVRRARFGRNTPFARGSEPKLDLVVARA